MIQLVFISYLLSTAWWGGWGLGVKDQPGEMTLWTDSVPRLKAVGGVKGWWREVWRRKAKTKQDATSAKNNGQIP